MMSMMLMSIEVVVIATGVMLMEDLNRNILQLVT